MDEKDTLIRHVFELARELAFQHHLGEFLGSRVADRAFPDPKLRIGQLRGQWNALAEKVYPKFKKEIGAMTTDVVAAEVAALQASLGERADSVGPGCDEKPSQGMYRSLCHAVLTFDLRSEP